MDFLLVIQIAPQRVEPPLPELLVLGQPDRSLAHRLGREFATHHAPFLRTADQSGLFQHPQVLHEPRQGHAVRLRQFGDRGGPSHQALHHFAPGRIRERGEHPIQHLFGAHDVAISRPSAGAAAC